jgi:hypothetical protein
MEKATAKEITTVQITHSFYCDECGEHLGDSIECDDGYYDKFGEFEQKICVDRKWYAVKKNLCEEHKKQFVDKTISALMLLGFEPKRM